MNIEELKRNIELGAVSDSPLIFKDDESMFLSKQYIKAISDVKHLKIEYIESLSEALSDEFDFFGCCDPVQPSALKVLMAPVYLWGEMDITRTTNVIVVITKFKDKEEEKRLAEHIVNMPKLEDWQIKDYVYSVCTGVDQKDLDYLLDVCGNNICRIQHEIDKLSIFSETERKYLFHSYINDGALDDLSSFNIFNFTNAITSKNIQQLKNIYKELDRIDVNEFGLLTILLKNFRNILLVQLSSNPTPENTGLDSKQLYAIKKIPRVYSPEQLVSIFKFLCDIDRQVKEGELPADIVIDYIIAKVLSI